MSVGMDDMEEDMEHDNFMLDGDLLVCVWGSLVLGVEVALA